MNPISRGIRVSDTDFTTFLGAFGQVEEASRSLDGNQILCPPVADFGYDATPRNTLTFAALGADGVHWAIWNRDGVVRDDSPVLYVSPMEDEWIVMADSFRDFLADGCGVSVTEIAALLDAERFGRACLVAYLAERFCTEPLLDEARTSRLLTHWGPLITANTPSSDSPAD
jgi:hypothetical protein